MSGFEAMVERCDERLPGMPIYYVSNENPDADSMVVLMPAAISSAKRNKSLRHYARWSWNSSWPQSIVLAVADPAIMQSEHLLGAWYIHREHDVLAGISAAVASIASEAGISPDRIVFYGSSLGGFGALACAALLPGSRAVAEVPQTDFTNWIQGSVESVERYILGEPLSEFAKMQPEKIRIDKRFEMTGTIPPFVIITNRADRSFADQRELVRWCEDSSLRRLGEQKLVISDRVNGHRPLERADAIAYVNP